jgi:hypothetical protein
MSEISKLLELIDIAKIKNIKERLFVESMQSHIRVGASISNKQLYWLRDIKDRQLEKD